MAIPAQERTSANDSLQRCGGIVGFEEGCLAQLMIEGMGLTCCGGLRASLPVCRKVGYIT